MKWSLSDISCWLPEAQFHEVLRLAVGADAPGSRYCFRSFAARRELPRGLEGRVLRLRELGEQLNHKDSSVIYRFEVGSYPGRLASTFGSAGRT